MKDFEQELNNRLVDLYHNVLMTEETKRKYSKPGFSFRDRNAIDFLGRHPEGATPSEIADYLKISRPSATTIIKKLQKSDIVVKSSLPGDSRNTRVALTRKGKMFAVYQNRYRKRMTNAICEDLDEEERAAFLKVIGKLNGFFESSIEEMEEIHNNK